MNIPEKFTIDIPPKITVTPRLEDQSSVLSVLKEWKEAVKTQPTQIQQDEDIPEDIREDVLRLRQKFTDLGIDVESMYRVDFDIGGAALATSVGENKVQIHFKYDEWKEK